MWHCALRHVHISYWCTCLTILLCLYFTILYRIAVFHGWVLQVNITLWLLKKGF